jgi:hypothetical protein
MERAGGLDSLRGRFEYLDDDRTGVTVVVILLAHLDEVSYRGTFDKDGLSPNEMAYACSRIGQ